MKWPSRMLCVVCAWIAADRPATAAENFEVDSVHSSVIFRVKHMDVSYAYGRFDSIAGKFAFDEKEPAQSRLELTINAESISTANAMRDRHLKGPDFFNAKQFPAITFKSKSVGKGARPGEFLVTGDLTVRGVTRPAEVNLSVVGTGKGTKGESISGVEGTLLLKRSDFGMTYMVGPIGDEVRVTASLEGSHR